jgi:exodeoxyribonuclease VII large subunit
VGVEPALTWTVAQVTELASVAVEQAFGGLIWVEGEICNLSRSARGHVYFSLIEPGSDQNAPDIQLSVTLFDWNRQKVNLQIRRAGEGMRMTNGVKVRIRGTVELYQAKGQLQLKMIAIDPAYTLGDLAAVRAALLARLAADDLLDANGRLAMPMLPLRVGLVTSLGSAAHADFRHEIEASALPIDVLEFDARVQGIEADDTLEEAVFAAADAAVHVICIVRGGGAQTDLAAFDTERVARAIATSWVPVWVGIGHEIDRTVADVVAHSSHKTPTACAAALVTLVRQAIDQPEEAWAGISRKARGRLETAEAALEWTEVVRRAERQLVGATARLAERSSFLQRGVGHRLDMTTHWLDGATATVVATGPRQLRNAERELDAVAAQVRAFDPARIVERGWSLTRRADGTVVRSVAELDTGDELVTRLADGEVRSTVQGVKAAVNSAANSAVESQP